jgi:tetratricopeptide (TPR) repeat protein
VHLGHIYAETGDWEAARDCYEQALVASDYSDNNTITAPAVNWYLREGRKAEALAKCEEILRHNPANSIASAYLRQIREGQ